MAGLHLNEKGEFNEANKCLSYNFALEILTIWPWRSFHRPQADLVALMKQPTWAVRKEMRNAEAIVLFMTVW